MRSSQPISGKFADISERLVGHIALTYRLASGEGHTMASLRTIERDENGKVVWLGGERAPPGGGQQCACICMAGGPSSCCPMRSAKQRASAQYALACLAKAGAVKVSRVDEPPDDTLKTAG